VLPPAASFILAPLLSRFLAHYPAIDLEISVDAALTDIVAGRFDAGMRAGDRIERDMIAVRIGEEICGVVVATPGYLARHPRPTTPKDLGAHDCIRFRFPSGVIVPWRYRHQQVPADPADQPFDFAFIVAFAGPPEPIFKHVMGL
jgi:DNA-binding transcriptional LysR family regulator